MFNFSEISCVKCAKCVPTCTIHQINPDETTSPRGFLHLLGEYSKGELPLDKNAKNIFESCFLCYQCTTVCPADIPTAEYIEKIRVDLAKEFKLAWFKRLFFFILRHRKLMDLASKLGFVVKSCGLFKSGFQDGMSAKIPLPFLKKNRLIPSVSHKSFINSYPEYVDFKGNRQVIVFIGCMANYNYTNVGDSLLYILKHLNINAFIPPQQLCCGAPAYFTGDINTTKHLIKKNISYFGQFIDDFEAILIPEATCSSMIINDWKEIIKQDESIDKKTAEKIIKKSFISSKWLYENTDLKNILKDCQDMLSSVTYHDPCHAKKTQNVYKEVRELLGENYKLTEMSDSSRCCGFGGVTMQTEKRALSIQAGDPKAIMIKETKANFVSAECSACRMQLSDALERNKAINVFIHPLELIAKALKTRKKQ